MTTPARIPAHFPTREQELRAKLVTEGLLPGEQVELRRIQRAKQLAHEAADTAAERQGEGRLLPAGRTNIHD
jgi:hypothetical protein